MKGILIDTITGDLMITKHSLQLGDTEHQIVELLLKTAPGDWKETPMLGADARSLLGGNIDPFWAGRAKKMIKAAGVEVKNVKYNEGIITIE